MILDLSVKKDMKKGWMDNFLGGMGSKKRYEVANTMNRIRENSQFTVIANWNNTNNQGFSELQQQSSNATGNNPWQGQEWGLPVHWDLTSVKIGGILNSDQMYSIPERIVRRRVRR